MIRDVRVVRVHAETFERVQIVLEIETEHRQAGVVREAVSRALPEALGAVREQPVRMTRSSGGTLVAPHDGTGAVE